MAGLVGFALCQALTWSHTTFFGACRLGAGVQARLEADPSVLSRLGRDCCLDLLAILAVSLARQNGLEADLVASRVRAPALICGRGSWCVCE